MCKGKEWLLFDVDPGHPDWNKLTRCPTCGTNSQREYLRNMCGLSPEMQAWTFEATRRNPSNAAAYDVGQLLARNPAYFYTLLGGFGVGKTRLLACIVNEARAAGWTAVYTTTADVLDHLRSAYAPKAAIGFDGRFELLKTARVLCLDEFDRWSPTEWAEEKFFRLIEARYQDGARLLTCFAANARLDELPGYVRSRIEDSRCKRYQLAGMDVRRAVR